MLPLGVVRVRPTRHLGRPVAVVAELGVLDEPVLSDEGLEVGHADVVVVDAVLLAGARGARRVRHGEGEDVGVPLHQALEEGALADARGA